MPTSAATATASLIPTTKRRPFQAGDRLTWTQVHADGVTATERTGEVWSLAPVTAGCQSLWVLPDESLPTDAYPAAVMVLVLPANRRKQLWRETRYGYRADGHHALTIPAGGAFSEDHPYSRTGAAVRGLRLPARSWS
jgi:hypothetical protein